MDTIAELLSRHTMDGEVRWIGVRPERRADIETLTSVTISETGLGGDRRATPGKRAVTLIQFEHLAVIASLTGRNAVDPALLRRNIAISGINLLGLRDRKFSLGRVLLEGTGICAPCSRMEEILGHGGYSAVRGHGGITASVVEGGDLKIGDVIHPL